MTDINLAMLRRLDMTMLLVLSETLRLRKLTLVAKRLGLTQSAVSHILTRLRLAFDDPLFLRKPHGLEPTSRALVLEPKLAAILDMAQSALQVSAPFDPRTARRQIRIGTLDYTASIFAPALCRVFEAEAPGLSLSIQSVARKQSIDMLANNELDIALGFVWDLAPPFQAVEFYKERYAVVARKNHPSFDGSLKSYLAQRHVLVSISGDARGIVDSVLDAKKLKRHVSVVLPLFFPALATVAETDLVATLPYQLAKANCARFKLTMFEPPFAIRSFPIQAIRHARTEKDACLDWVTNQLRRTASGLLG